MIHTINQISDRIKLNGYFFFHTPMLLGFYELERNPQQDSDYPQTNLLFHRLDLFFTLSQAESLQPGTNVNLINRIKRHSKKERTTNRNARLGFRPAMRRKLSRPGIPSCNAQEAFPAWDSVLQCAGSFPGLGFRPATRRKLSRLAIPSCNAQEEIASYLAIPAESNSGY